MSRISTTTARRREKVRWRRGAKADVYVIADSGRGRHVVRVRRR